MKEQAKRLTENQGRVSFEKTCQPSTATFSRYLLAKDTNSYIEYMQVLLLTIDLRTIDAESALLYSQVIRFL